MGARSFSATPGENGDSRGILARWSGVSLRAQGIAALAVPMAALFSISRAENEVAYTDLIAVNAYDTRAELLLGRRAWDFMDPAAVTDPSRFKQILYNYLSNAVKFTPGGGQVVARVIPEGDSLFRLEEEHPGVGIAPGEIPRLFQEFRQLSSRKPEQGTGLGLALTRHIVEAQGGRVDVRSVPVPDKAACSRRSCRWRRSRRHRRKASELPKQPTF
jgi:signal transduction histidine kinase